MTLLIATLLAAPVAASAGGDRDVTAQLRTRIAAELPADFAVIGIDVPVAMRDLPGDPAVRWPRAARPGWMSVEVTFANGHRGWVRVHLAAQRTVLVATRALRPGEVLVASDVAIERRPAVGLDVAPEIVAGVTVTRAIAAGDPIGADSLALPPPMPRGAEVDVVVRRGAITVMTRGKLEAPARLGEPVAVRLGTTRTVQRGRLVGVGTVAVGELR